jgi:hypothetical protein
MMEFGKIIDSKIIVFGTTIEHGGRCEKEQPKVGPKGEGVGTTESNDTNLHGWAEKRRAMLGPAKLALCFQIPSQASLHGILKSIAHYARQMALRFRFAQRFLGENTGLRLVSKRGCVVKKHRQARLRGSFSQHIQHSHSESARIFYLFIRVHPSYPWFKNALFAAQMSSWGRCSGGCKADNV